LENFGFDLKLISCPPDPKNQLQKYESEILTAIEKKWIAFTLD